MKRGQSKVPIVVLSTVWVISVQVVGGCSWAHADDGQAVSVERDVKIPMRDGINLGATIFKPKEMQKPLPGITHFSPYIAEGYSGRARFFARRGYIVALVDVRGRGNSEGQFKPFVNDGPDGHDVVEWLASRPWTNGKVAMFGGSYTGWDQWSVIKEFPPHLETIIPVASTYPGTSGIPKNRNIFLSYVMHWLNTVSDSPLSVPAQLWITCPDWSLRQTRRKTLRSGVSGRMPPGFKGSRRAP